MYVNLEPSHLTFSVDHFFFGATVCTISDFVVCTVVFGLMFLVCTVSAVDLGQTKYSGTGCLSIWGE